MRAIGRAARVRVNQPDGLWRSAQLNDTIAVSCLLAHGLGIRVGADASGSSRSRTCVASTKSKRTVPSLNVSPAWNALSPNVWVSGCASIEQVGMHEKS